VEQLARGRRVLDAYCYVGSFAMAAARGGAREVLAVDESAIALEAAARCAAQNGLADRIAFVCGSAREALGSAAHRGGFDLVVVDPPAMAPSQRALPKALGAYQKLAAAACRATRPGGLLVVCSCSAAVGFGALTRAVALGARDVGMSATVLERMFQGADHPVPAAFPEGLYLKSVIVRVDVA
jgi:23S rRNA (cytosine1962-C5)-methyltransferase